MSPHSRTTVETDIPSYAEKLGEHAAGLSARDAPAEVLQKVKACMLYGLTMTLASPAGDPFHAAVRASVGGSAGPAQLLHDGAWRAAPDAAFVNADRIAARSQADTHLDSQAHIGCVVIPAVLALAQWRGSTGAQILSALLAGYETLPKIARNAAARSTKRGFRATAIYGPFASAAATANLLGLDARSTGHALALAANFSSGLSQCWAEGTLEARLHVAAASRNGLIAALLAEQGIEAADKTFEGNSGFFRAFADDVPPLDLDGWDILRTSFKPYPGCALNQPAVDTVRRIMRDIPGGHAAVAAVEVRMNPMACAYPGVNAYGPFPASSGAVMSAPFMVEAMLQHGQLRRHHFDDLHADAEFNQSSRRVRLTTDPTLALSNCVVRVQAGGADLQLTFEEDVPFSLGWEGTARLAHDVSQEWECSDGQARFNALVETVASLEHANNADALMRLCVFPPPDSVPYLKAV